MVDGFGLPAKGSAVSLDRASQSITGTVVWQADNVRGIRFDTEIDVGPWVKRVGHVGQQSVDRAVQALKAGKITREQVPRRSLRDLGQELRQICEKMASTPILTIEEGETLVRIEAIAVELARIADDL
jgi:hypothetical protein